MPASETIPEDAMEVDPLFAGPPQKAEWMSDLGKSDWLFDGYPIRGEVMLSRFETLDWSKAWVDMGPSIAGNPGPYWHVPLVGEETIHRLYPKLLQGKWLPLVRQAVSEAVALATAAERERCARVAERDADWTAFSRRSKLHPVTGDETNVFAAPDDETLPTPANVFAYRMGIAAGRAIAAAIRSGDHNASIEKLKENSRSEWRRAEAAEARCDKLAEALSALVNAKALQGVREIVAGWNGENLPDGKRYGRHPEQLGATLPKTTCGAIYELDETLVSAREALEQVGKR